MIAAEAETTYPKVVVRKLIRAKQERVFDAWTKAELLQQWFFPKGGSVKATNELKVGGSYAFEMMGCASTCSPETGEPISKAHNGNYLEIQRPYKIVFTWNSPSVKDTRVTVDFKDLGDSTEVIITHELLATEELRQGHSQGWESIMESLSSLMGEQ